MKRNISQAPDIQQILVTLFPPHFKAIQLAVAKGTAFIYFKYYQH